MDKPKRGNTITIKINGNDRHFKDRNQEPTSEQIKEKDQKESKLSDNVKQESAAAKEPIEEGENFEWILPSKKDSQEIKEYKTVSFEKKDKQKDSSFLGKGSKKTKQERKGFITSIFFATFFAVVLGTIFGLIMLNIVLSEQGIGEKHPAPAVGNEEKTSDKPSEKPTASGSVEITLPSLTTYVVQEGIYSSQGGAEQKQTELKGKGIPAEIIELNGKFALFVGVADSVDHAKTRANQLATSGIVTFSKELAIGEKKVAGLQAEESKLLELAPQFYQTLTESVTTKMISDTIPADMKKNLDKQAASIGAIDKKKLQNKEINQLQVELEAASTQLNKYVQNPDSSILNSIQQHLLSSLSSYQRL